MDKHIITIDGQQIDLRAVTPASPEWALLTSKEKARSTQLRGGKRVLERYYAERVDVPCPSCGTVVNRAKAGQRELERLGRAGYCQPCRQVRAMEAFDKQEQWAMERREFVKKLAVKPLQQGGLLVRAFQQRAKRRIRYIDNKEDF